MALRSTTSDAIPSDAIRLTKDEAVQYQFNIIENWTNEREIWFLKNGMFILGFGSSISSAIIHNYFRWKLRVSNYGRVSSYLPVVLIPSFITILNHKRFVLNDVIVQKITCPVCTELKAIGHQFFGGVVYPMVLSPITTFIIAERHYTYKVPDPRVGIKKYGSFLYNITKNLKVRFLAIVLSHALLASAVTYMEARDVVFMNRELIRREKEKSGLFTEDSEELLT